MVKKTDANVRRTPEEVAQTAKEWVSNNGAKAQDLKEKLAKELESGPIHASLLSSILTGDIPKPLTSIVRALGDDFAIFKISDNPYVPGQPALALKKAMNRPGYWKNFRMNLRSEVSPWVMMGIPSAGVIIGRIRYEIFSAFLRSIDPSVGKSMLTSAVMILFQKAAGMKFSEFFNGKPGQIASMNADGNELFCWTTSDDIPPLLSVCRVKSGATTPLEVVPQLALRDLRSAMVGKAPEAIDFDSIVEKHRVDRDSVLFAYLKELGNAVRNAQGFMQERGAGKRPEMAESTQREESVSSEEIVTGTVLFTSNSGVGVDVRGRQGFVPKSELSWDFVEDPAAIVHVGGIYRFKIIPDLHNNGGLFLSLKQMTEDPWKTVAARFPIGKPVPGVVVRYTDADDAALVSLAPGVTGRLQLHEMTPDVRRSTASESLPKGSRVTVAVMVMNREHNWLQLTMNVRGAITDSCWRKRFSRSFLIDGSNLISSIGVANTSKVAVGLMERGFPIRAFFAAADFHTAGDRKHIEDAIPQDSLSILSAGVFTNTFLLYASRHDEAEIVTNAEYSQSKFPIAKERVHNVSEAFGEILLPSLGITLSAV